MSFFNFWNEAILKGKQEAVLAVFPISSRKNGCQIGVLQPYLLKDARMMIPVSFFSFDISYKAMQRSKFKAVLAVSPILNRENSRECLFETLSLVIILMV